jgi:hypothetical protein
MTVLQNISLSSDAIKVRWQEPYITAGLNQKAIASAPRGVVAGFTVQPATGYSVTIVPDPTLGLSIANVLETTAGKFSVTLVQSASLFLDLTPQAGLTVYIVLDAQYAVGSASAAQLKVVDALDPDFVVLAKVNVPASPVPGGPITAAHINLGYITRAGDSVSELAKPRTNLVFNPDFAWGITTGWTFSGFTTAGVSTDLPTHSDTYSLKLTRSTAASATATSGPMPVVPGQKYRVGAWWRNDGVSPITSGNGVRLRVSWRNSSDVQLSVEDVESAFTGAGATFVEARTETTAPALATHARIEIFFDGCSGVLYVDDVEFSHARAEALSRAPVFGGSSSAGDLYHTHTAAGLSYAGNTGPAPANWVLSAGTAEAALDQIGNDLSGSGGAANVGFVATTPKDLPVGAVTIKSALDTLDDLKAGIDLANLFSGTNTFAPTAFASGIIVVGNGSTAPTPIPDTAVQIKAGSSVNAVGLTVTTASTGGSAISAAVVNAASSGYGVSGSTTGTSAGVVGVSTGTGYGVIGSVIGAGQAAVRGQVVGGIGFGVLGQGFAAVPVVPVAASQGVVGVGGTDAVGVEGYGHGLGTGVVGRGGATNGVGVEGLGTASGYGVYGKGSGGAASIPSKSRQGVLGVGGSSGVGVEGVGEGAATGVVGTGGVTDGVGVHGLGSGVGAGVKGSALASFAGIGVLGLGASAAAPTPAGEGVYGVGSTASGTGVVGKGGAGNGVGVHGLGTGSGAGVVGSATSASSDGVIGIGLGGSGSPIGKVGVFGAGGSSSGTGVQGRGGTTNGIGVFGEGTGDGIGVKATASGAGAAVEGTTTGSTYGVRGVYSGGGSGAGIRGESGTPASPAGSFNNSTAGYGIDVTGGVGGTITGTAGVALRLQQSSVVSLEADGYIDLNGGGTPALGDPLNNNLTKSNIVAHWAVIQLGAAGADYNILAGYNVNNTATPAKRVGNVFYLNLIGTMASANYFCECRNRPRCACRYVRTGRFGSRCVYVHRSGLLVSGWGFCPNRGYQHRPQQ